MISLGDIPRVDRGAIWGRAEEIQRIIEVSTPSAIMLAMQEYIGIRGEAIEEKLTDAVKYNPEVLFKKRKGSR